MLLAINPKIPMRDKETTKKFYLDGLGFEVFGNADYDEYLMLAKDKIQIHFFLFRELNPHTNYGQVYIRVKGIEAYYGKLIDEEVSFHPNGNLRTKPWGQKEFSVLDPDNNLLTFGEQVM